MSLSGSASMRFQILNSTLTQTFHVGLQGIAYILSLAEGQGSAVLFSAFPVDWPTDPPAYHAGCCESQAKIPFGLWIYRKHNSFDFNSTYSFAHTF